MSAVSAQRFAGQVAAVTGAAQGLGAAVARRLAEEGCLVAVADVNLEGVEQLVASLPPGRGHRADRVDVRDPVDADSWLRDVHDQMGRLDVLVCAAGIIRDNRVERISDEDWHAVVDVSLTGTFNCVRTAVPLMRGRGHGRILCFSSISWHGNYGQANYAAAKAGLVGFARTVALETARAGITVNVIAPGLIETPMLASMDERGRDLLTGKVPMRRIGDPSDIAEAAAYLCSPQAGYVSGIVLDVDGGISIGSAIR